MTITSERRRSPILVLGVAGAVVVMLAVVTVVIVAALTRGGGPADEFEQAAEQFNSQYEPLARQLDSNMDRAGGGLMDAGLLTAQQDARALGDLFDTYGEALAAIEFPAEAEQAATQLANAIEAGKILMVNAAQFFAKGPMQSTLDNLQPETEDLIAEREEALRQALGSS
ncbi:hypothetical protein [Micromonospora sp. NBC_01813]|uniref:hypothetical protein n=1 Tax=Micromonospora sp. NBC_01813 TaxID=2975988 RepID=UPI002DD87355|nr:hypothetical protein [Micromonospora sp. NBC_01813]WSA09767.1 hypothetical protein OG958_02825 [Micromonospora sp. NBC_01813]